VHKPQRAAFRNPIKLHYNLRTGPVSIRRIGVHSEDAEVFQLLRLQDSSVDQFAADLGQDGVRIGVARLYR